jgi:hypothetical protein
MKDPYSISIVTAIKERYDFFPNVIKNLNSQNYIFLELVVIDASPTSKNKIAIIENSRVHTIYLNEKDHGLYDGFNKGLLLLQGKHFSFLNSDDWYEKDFCNKSIKIFKQINPDFTFGNIILHKESFVDEYIAGSPLYFKNPLYNYIKFHHNTVMCKSNLIFEIGLFVHQIQIYKKRYSIKIGSDYHWFLECVNKNKIGYYIFDILGHMRWGGASNFVPGMAARECGLIAYHFANNRSERVKILIVWTYRFLQDKYHVDRFKNLSKNLSKMYRKIYFK